MGYSPLTTRIQPPRRQTYGNKWSTRDGTRVSRVIVHHWAGLAGGVERLVNSADKASANYIILTDGTLIGSVDEDYRAWTSSSAAADRPSITVEVQNSTAAPEWRVSDAAMATLTALVADIGARHGFVPRAGSTVRGHRDFAATACPGPYLYPRLAQIAQPSTAPPAPSKKGHDMIELIRTLYRRYLDRIPTTAEELSWSDAFAILDLNAAAHAHFRTSPAEGGTIVAAYRTHLGRDATTDEVKAWSQGLTIDQVWTGVGGSSEAAARR